MHRARKGWNPNIIQFNSITVAQNSTLFNYLNFREIFMFRHLHCFIIIPQLAHALLILQLTEVFGYTARNGSEIHRNFLILYTFCLYVFIWVFVPLCIWYVDYGIAVVVIRINSLKICRERKKFFVFEFSLSM